MKKFRLFLLLVGVSVNLSAQDNYSVIDVEDTETFSEFDLLGDTLDHYTVYFTGENHNYPSFNTKLEYKLLRYLHQSQGVRHFIFEQGPAVGYLINEAILYENEENMNFLKDVFYDPFYYLIKKLQRMNDSLSMEDKVKVHGIDVERFPYFSIYALNQIVDTLDRSVFGGEVFEQIEGLNTSPFKNGQAADFYGEETDNRFGFGEISAWGTLSSIIISSYEFRDSLAPVLGENEAIYYAIIASLEKGKIWYQTEKEGDLKSPIIRERFMRKEFERIYRLYPDSKFYGQFGRCHLHKDKSARKCYDYYMNSVANRINEIDSSLNNKVMVIPIFYSKGKQKLDKDIIENLNFEEKFFEDDKVFLIDLSYKKGDHPIVGFYNELPFMILSNMEVDPSEQYDFSWNTTIQEYHLGAYYGYHYFNKIRTLNTALQNLGANNFTTKWVAYDFAFDVFKVDDAGSKFDFTYYPRISNGDNFEIRGWRFGVGSYYAFGNKWLIAAPGLQYGYGQFYLTEFTDNTIPNLIQVNEQNASVYKNDIFYLEPNLELRLTLPFLSFNFKTGYSFDVSGKRWRLDGKQNNFTKTSFSAPYIQAGVSLNYKSIK
ncbi:MAG: hypothetical protein WDZ35_14600 [Crocinitomicaceae bacterium]